MSVPVVHWNHVRADNAWKAYQALRFAERDRPDLKDNPAWNILVADAYEEFSLAFEKAEG